MSGAGPKLPTLPELRALLDGARLLETPSGAVLELCILSLCLPWEAVAIDLDQIDWSSGFVEVPARGGRTRIVALPDAAMKAILRIAGSASGRGQAITAGRGRRLSQRDVRLDRLQDDLAEVSPATGEIDWNFHGIRAAGRFELTNAGVAYHAICAAAGPDDRRLRDRGMFAQRQLAELAATTIETWCRLLLGSVP